MTTTRILCIDGGGIRGLIPAVWLTYLEQELQQATDDPQARLSDFFDLIAGTSTGGMLACVLVAPDADGQARFTAQEAVQLYQQMVSDDGFVVLQRAFFGGLRLHWQVSDIRRGLLPCGDVTDSELMLV